MSNKMDIKEMNFCVKYSNEKEWNVVQSFLLAYGCEWTTKIKWQKKFFDIGYIFSNYGKLAFSNFNCLKYYPEETLKFVFTYEEFCNKFIFIFNSNTQKQEKKSMLVKYLRKNNKPYACLISKKVDDQVVIGYSLCHKNDVFNKKTATMLAEDRITEITDHYSSFPMAVEIPNSIKNEFMSFVRRSKKFFKTNKMFAKYITEIELV